MNIFIKYIAGLILSSIILFSCKKFISIPPPETLTETAQVFENDHAAIAATVGVYSQMMQTSMAIGNGGSTLYPSLSADELYNTAANADYDQFRLNEIQPSLSTGLSRLWTFGYRNIYHANAVIEGLNKSMILSDTLKKQLKGEMLVVRAFHYFYLLNFFGDVPLVLTTDFRLNERLPRSSVAEVYNLIMTDLQEAKSLLKTSYPSAGKVRPNKWTAAALLSRVHLFMQNWTQAEAEVTEVFNGVTYSLATNLNSVFLTNSTEAIWQLNPVSTTINTAEGNFFNPSSSTTRPTFAATPFLINAFEINDQRKTTWLKSTVVSSQTFFYPYKYKIRTGAPPYTEYYMVIRLAELYLIRAEARAKQNNITGSQEDLNRIRNRSGLANITANTLSLLLSAIEQERRIELMMEWGHRWLDLKRTGRVNGIISSLKSSWQPTDALYPIPKYELETNPFLVQNPGY